MLNPFNDNPFSAFVEAWHEGETSTDPFTAMIEFHRAEARYLKHELGRAEEAAQVERFANRLEKLIEAVENLHLDYRTAAQLCEWTYGTIKNKASSKQIETVGGKVPVHQLLVGPRQRGLRAYRVIADMEEARREDRAEKVKKRRMSSAERRAYALGSTAA